MIEPVPAVGALAKDVSDTAALGRRCLSGGRILLFSGSSGNRGSGGWYAGYFELISCRKRW